MARADNPVAHGAFDKMHRAYQRKTGCRLSALEIATLGLTFLGEVWAGDADEVSRIPGFRVVPAEEGKSRG